MEKYIPKIKEGFTDNKGNHYPNIREIAYEQGKTFGSFGTLIGESGIKDFDNDETLDGVYAFRSHIDPSKVYRIYKDFLTPNFNYEADAKFISELQKYNKDVKLSEFPTGVVTEGGRIIGHEVPFVDGITLKEYSENNKNEIIPTKIYIQILDILRELYINKIYYLDIHERNFMIKDGIVKLIDFDNFFVRIGNITVSDKRLMFDYLKMMLEELNKNFGIADKIGIIDGLDDAYQKVFKLEENLIKRGYNK